MGKTAVRGGSSSGSAFGLRNNGVRRSAPFDVHEYTPLPERKVQELGCEDVGDDDVRGRCGETDISLAGFETRFGPLA
jgi:hypothetical protein